MTDDGMPRRLPNAARAIVEERRIRDIVICRYTQADDTVIVLRVVHGRRRIAGRLLTEAP